MPGRVRIHDAATTEVHGLRVLDSLDFPRETLAQPRIRFFNLVSVLDTLVEHAVLVAYAVADDRQRQRCTTVQEAGGQAAETAIAEAGVMFAFVHVLEFDTQAGERLCRFIFDTEIE